MVEGHGATDIPWRLNACAYAAMAGAGTLPASHRQRSRPRTAFEQCGRHRTGRRDETGRNVTLTRFTPDLMIAPVTPPQIDFDCYCTWLAEEDGREVGGGATMSYCIRQTASLAQ